jgi:hypothetical protein
MKKQEVSKRAWALFSRLRTGQELHAETDKTEDGIRKGGLRFWMEPCGAGCGPRTARELIDAGLVTPVGDGLLDGVTQTWVAAPFVSVAA